MLKVEAGCAVFQELVQAANPVRRIKLPNPWIACCMLSTINHCAATAAGEGVRVPEHFGKEQCHQDSWPPFRVLQPQPLSDHLAPALDECFSGRCGWREYSAPLSHHILQPGVLSQSLAGFLLCWCAGQSVRAAAWLPGRAGHSPASGMAPRATATSSCCSARSVCRACTFQKAVLVLPLVEYWGTFQRSEYFSHTNFIKLHEFFLRSFVPSHPQSIQSTVSHHIPAYKPSQTTTPCTLYAQGYVGCHPLPKAVNESELKRNRKSTSFKQTNRQSKERKKNQVKFLLHRLGL